MPTGGLAEGLTRRFGTCWRAHLGQSGRPGPLNERVCWREAISGKFVVILVISIVPLAAPYVDVL